MADTSKIREFLNSLAEKWFKWLRWALTTAALWAVAEKSGSIFLKILPMLEELPQVHAPFTALAVNAYKD